MVLSWFVFLGLLFHVIWIIKYFRDIKRLKIGDIFLVINGTFPSSFVIGVFHGLNDDKTSVMMLK